MRYWTSDLHLNSPGTIQWFNRPFTSVTNMNERLIKTINQRCNTGYDVLVHVGDFAFTGKERGVPCAPINPRKHIEQINPSLVLIEGNHDLDNRVPVFCRYFTTALGDDTFKRVSVGHHPSNDPLCEGQLRKHSIRICGHVHNSWKFFYHEEMDILNINVGCDVWRWMPVSEVELINYIYKIQKQLGKKFK